MNSQSDLFEDYPTGSQEVEDLSTLNELIRRAVSYDNPESLEGLMKFVTNMPQIAPFNAMLLQMQNPNIRYALSAREWESKFQREVKVTARPYVILYTMGPVAFVFDVADTEPINPDFDPFKSNPPNSRYFSQTISDVSIHRAIDVCASIGIEVVWRDLRTVHFGRAIFDPQHPAEYRIELNSKTGGATALATLAHELGHILCGHFGSSPLSSKVQRPKLSHVVEELEAECTAYLVCSRLGIQTDSEAYLNPILKRHAGSRGRLPNYGLHEVLTAAGQIEKIFTGKLRPRPGPKIDLTKANPRSTIVIVAGNQSSMSQTETV
jgi:hypothetical protein